MPIQCAIDTHNHSNWAGVIGQHRILLEIAIAPNHQEHYKKEPRRALFVWTSPTSHAYSGAQMFRHAAFCVASADAFKEASSSRKR